jgi:hypothetical protein
MPGMLAAPSNRRILGMGMEMNELRHDFSGKTGLIKVCEFTESGRKMGGMLVN